MGRIKKGIVMVAAAIGLGALFMPKEGKEKIKKSTKKIGKSAAKIMGEAASETVQDEVKKDK
ncbi:MAG: hypothetical protein ACFFCQ_05810 [Promethearchaeota archaeon]